MENILFVKYNSTRKDKYRIKTEIVDDGIKKYVRKVSLDSEADLHISKLADYANQINEVYSNFKAVVPVINKSNMAVYPFIEGLSEESRLKKYLGDKASLINGLHTFVRRITELKNDRYVVFNMSDEFASIFGDESKYVKLEGLEATCVANIDMIPENFIWSDDNLYCLDCEWVLQFPVPLEFIKYRSLLYFYRKFSAKINELMSLEEYWNAFGITEEKLDIYACMEVKFQETINGINNSCRYTDRYIKNIYDYDTLKYRNELFDSNCKRIDQLQEENEERNNHIHNLDSHIEELDQIIKDNNDKINELSEKNKVLEEKVKEKEKEVKEKEKENFENIDRLSGIEFDLEQNKKLVHDKEIHIRNIEAELNNKIAELSQKQTEILTLNHQINLKENHIRNIELYANLWMNRENRFSKRVIRFPKKVLKKIYHKIKDEDNIEKLSIPNFLNPKVSIVIPVYNQFDYTHACIKSIIETVKDVSYEIIIGDDMSTDATKKIKKYVSGVRVNINKTDHGFLMNCNRAAKLAKGEYIIFLNNDTQVHEEWLSSLVQLIESDDKIGMVGSKLVYPDGSLQEAGGIIWSDASGWNYGRNQNADMPEYNYVRECDYISGASIMISKALWNEIGGFDERFKPAYCEDSDLAFEVRKRGYKVMYQPKSVVTHFEGVSNGTELDSGLKKYQVENSKKFKEKWASELSLQYESGHIPFCARERNHGKKIVLFIDHYVPTYDKDAGSKTTFQYIKMFLEKGYIVKFIGDNYAQMEPYTTTLQQLGVEVLYGPWYAQNIFEWINENKEFISFAYLNRPHITEKYIDYIKENTDIKIVYYGHDLHFLRTQREYEIEKDEKKLAESKMWKTKEFDILRKAEMNYYPSYVEEEAIHAIDKNIPVKAITAYVFDKFIENYKYDVKNRSGILFVGGFAHGPNIDAVNWFAKEVYPLIREQNKDIDFYIVGSNAPEEIKQLNGNGIIFKGFVSEQELMELYSKCRVVVVPLRYGAGVKGKVVEAIYNGLPIVTTSVGAEGIAGVENVLKIEDNATDFAKTVVELYDNDDELVDLANKTQSFIKENFSIDAVWNIIKEDFQ